MSYINPFIFIEQNIFMQLWLNPLEVQRTNNSLKNGCSNILAVPSFVSMYLLVRRNPYICRVLFFFFFLCRVLNTASLSVNYSFSFSMKAERNSFTLANSHVLHINKSTALLITQPYFVLSHYLTKIMQERN